MCAQSLALLGVCVIYDSSGEFQYCGMLCLVRCVQWFLSTVPTNHNVLVQGVQLVALKIAQNKCS